MAGTSNLASDPTTPAIAWRTRFLEFEKFESKRSEEKGRKRTGKKGRKRTGTGRKGKERKERKEGRKGRKERKRKERKKKDIHLLVEDALKKDSFQFSLSSSIQSAP